MPKPIPDGFHTITPHIIVADGGAAMDFYQSAFDAKDCGRHFMPDGKSLMHGLMKIGDSFFMLAGEFPPRTDVMPRHAALYGVDLNALKR